MKKSKFTLFLLCCLVTTFSLSSCLNSSSSSDNNYSTITKIQRVLYHAAIDGSYSGYLYWYDPDNTTEKDSTALSWYISSSDSTITMPEFPVNLLSKFITNTTAKTILEATPKQNLTMTYYIPTTELTEYINKEYYRYGAYPTDNKMEFTYNGNNITINFGTSYTNYYVYYPMAVVYNSSYAQNIIIKSVEVNGTSCDVSNGFFWTIGSKQE
jgi:hypothetical protein